MDDIYPSTREELQADVGFLLSVIHVETKRLNDGASRIILTGISQGCATGPITMLKGQCKLGGLSGWVPFRAQIEEIGTKASMEPAMRAGLEKLSEWTIGFKDGPTSHVRADPFVDASVLLCHSVEDGVVGYRQACAALKGSGREVEWKECRDGRYWISEPQGQDAIVAFLAREASEQYLSGGKERGEDEIGSPSFLVGV